MANVFKASSQDEELSVRVFFITVIQSEKETKFLNVNTYLLPYCTTVLVGQSLYAVLAAEVLLQFVLHKNRPHCNHIDLILACLL